VIITKLPAGAYIGEHSDDPALTAYYNRHHLCLADNDSTEFLCGDELFRPKVGELFWFDNSQLHSVWNHGNTDRITLIIDIKKPVMKVFYGPSEQSLPEPVRIPRSHVSEVNPEVSYGVDSFAAAIPELKVIIPDHYSELALDHKEIPLDPDWDRYVKTEQSGSLHFFTMRLGNTLIGYIISLIGGHLHYKSTYHAVVDIYYVMPQYRRGGLGREFFTLWEKSLQDIGVKKIITGTKNHSSHIEFFQHLGYRQSDQLMIKLLPMPADAVRSKLDSVEC